MEFERDEFISDLRASDEALSCAIEPAQWSVLTMKELVMLACAIFVLAIAPALAQQSQQHTFRGASGRTVGTATTSGNQTTFRDAGGRTTGTATRDSGQTTFRDAGGRTTGTTTAPRR
jgi:hypothetical protein